MTSILENDLTTDAFLGGRLSLQQPRLGYRAGVDPVLLAAVTPATPGQSVLELGCGAGAALLCLGARVPDLSLTGVEVQPDYADLARINAKANGMAAKIICADLRSLPRDVTDQRFDHVIANPPYFDRTKGTEAQDLGRDVAFGGNTPLSDWITTASRRIAPKGALTLIQKADRLADILSVMPHDLGSIVIQPLAARTGRDADRVLISARKGGRAPLRLRAPIVLHKGDAHERDAPDYTDQISAVLRDAAGLDIRR